MIYQEYLAALPMGDLKTIAFTFGVQPGMISRARLIREITDQTFQDGFIDKCVDDLTENSRDILLAVLSAGDAGRIYDTRKHNNELVIDQLHGLLIRGLVIGRRGSYQNVDFVVPEDLRDVLIRYFTKQLAGCFSTEAEKTEDDKSRDLTIVRNVFSFVNGLRHNPARLTDRGLPYKRALDTMVKQQETVINGLSTPVQDLTEQMSFVMEYSRWSGLTREEGGRLRTDSRFDSWLKLSTAEKLENIMAFWKTQERACLPVVSALPGILQLCVGFGQVDLDQIMRCVLNCSSPNVKSESVTDNGETEVLTALRELEWIGLLHRYNAQNGTGDRLVFTQAGKHIFGGTIWSDEQAWSTRFIVQPTFEIITPRNLDLIIRDKLERCAELVNVDLMLTFRVTRDSVYRAGNNGMSGKQVIDFLTNHSEKNLPQNVTYSIQSWGETYGQIYFLDTFLLRTTTVEVASHIKANNELASYICGEVAPDALIVDRQKYRELMELLQKHGYMPKTKVLNTAELTSAPQSRRIQHSPIPDNEHNDPPKPSCTFKKKEPSSSAHSFGQDSVLGFGDSLPGYQQLTEPNSDEISNRAPHFEQAKNLQYLSPKHTEELLEMALTKNYRAVIDYYLANRSRSFLHRIKPVRIEKTRGTPYVEAHSMPEGHMHVFKISNIRAIRIVYEHDENEQ